nr:unnamed protein product [Digitaria exilis]
MTYQMWHIATSHAEVCDPGDKVYVYSGTNSTIYVDSLFNQLLKIEIDGVECWPDELFNVKANIAYEHRHNLQEVDVDDMEPLLKNCLIGVLLYCTSQPEALPSHHQRPRLEVGDDRQGRSIPQ